MTTAAPIEASGQTPAPGSAPRAMRADGAPAARPRTALVVGGGIAGIAAALRLADAGVAVTLLETRKKLGGRATSFNDVRTGLVIDNCQHVAMACCTSYLDLCARLGVLHQFEWRDEVYWAETGGRISVTRPGPLPAPAHFSLSMLSATFLNMSEKRAIARAMLALVKTDRRAHTQRTFLDWLTAHRQPARAIARFWEPVIVSACNLGVGRVSAASAMHVFQEGFLAHRGAARVGVSRVPLVQLYDRAEAEIARAGGSVRLGAGAANVGLRDVQLTSGETLSADVVICALPPERGAKVIDPALRAIDDRFERMGRITHSPILGVHLTFDRPVLPVHSAVLVERRTQWVFRKDDEGRMVHAVISAADEWLGLDEREVTRRVTEDLFACFPPDSSLPLRRRGRWSPRRPEGASDLPQVLSSRPVMEKFATFAPTPENEALRPATLGPSGLILAGDAVQTGWPATMEGATRSGYMAAAAALGERPESGLIAPLRPGMVVRAMGYRVPHALLHPASKQ